MIKKYDRTKIIEQSQKKVLYEEYVNKELIHHMNYNCERSIPSICDGLKVIAKKDFICWYKKKFKERN